MKEEIRKEVMKVFNEEANVDDVVDNTVKLPTQIMRDSKFWKEGKVYTCTNIVEFDRLDSEIYVDDNWISDSFTTVV